MSRVGGWILATIGWGFFLWAAPADSVTKPPENVDELIEVRRVRVPVVFEERAPGGCAGVTADRIEILEDGAHVPALHLEPRRRKAAHVILVDSGPRMLDAVREARTAARSYLSSLPADEPVLLATFDQRLTLRAPLSADRDLLVESLEWTEPGGGSHLWDSARQMIEYLGSRPERKVLLLVTDGCDSQLSSSVSSDDVIDLAVRTDALIVFPIGVNVPTRCEGVGGDPRDPLKALARWTGGSYQAPGSVTDLWSMFAAVQARMERERYVTYQPLPFGRGPKDRPGRQSYRWRKRKLRLIGMPACELVPAGPPVRYEDRSRGPFGVVPGAVPAAARGAFQLDRAGRTIDGTVRDVLRESGAVAPPLDVMFGLGKPGAESYRSELTVDRTVSALIPPFDRVVRTNAKPYDGVLYALARAVPSGLTVGSRRPGVPWLRWNQVPFLVNGRTLLDIRRPLAGALAEDPEYGRWAFERIRADRLETLDDLIRTTEPGEELELLKRARTVLAEQLWTPEAHEWEKHLGSWLGDLPVASTFNVAERWIARRVLSTARERGVKHVAGALNEAWRMWNALSVWFPEPEDARQIGILVPGYDPSQDAVGYYRVILQSPYSASIHGMLLGASTETFLGATGEGPHGATPGSLYSYLQSFSFCRQAPLGVLLVHWMLAQEEAARALLQHFEVESVHYAHPGVRDLLPTLLQGKLVERSDQVESYTARQVTVVLASLEDPGRRVAVSAYFPSDADGPGYLPEPACLVPPAEPPDLAAGRDLWNALASAKRRSSLPCVLRPAAGR